MKLTLAIALALSGAEALALGLGPIHVKSGLNQPLVAEIPVTGGADETGSLSVELASAEDFERVGLSRSRLGVPLEFTVAPGKNGAVIRVTTKEPVRDPFVDFLLEVNWGKGKLLREYTVLLDPPTMAPAVKGSTARVAPVKETTAAAPTETLPPSKPSKPPRSIAAPETPAAASEPKPVAAGKPSHPAARAAESGEYGPVNSGETLWDIASATRPDGDVSLNQMMVALLRSNPNAFYKSNINALKRGAILRIPSSDEIKAFGSFAAAAAEVRAQNESWRSGGAAAPTPTIVADTGKPAAPKSAAESPAAKSGDRLALVPPKAGSGSQSGADKAGTAAAGTGDATLKSELTRAKEALASRDQETVELKSRVKELEDIGAKNQRLLSLKDSELAELQKKLKELQDKAGAPAAPSASATATTPTATAATSAKPASTSAASTAAITKEDIWGNAAGEPLKPAASTAAPPANGTTATSAPAAASAPPAATAPGSATTTSTPAAPAASSPATTPSASAPSATTSSETTAASSSAAATPTAAPATGAPTMTVTSAAPGPAASTPASKPVTSTTSPAASGKPAKLQPLPVEEPWYRKIWLLAIAGAAVLGIVLVAMLNLRRRPKAAPAAAGPASFATSDADEESQLLQHLARAPDDVSTHLELASLYYARHDVDKFEAAAQAMYAHIGDGNEAEWEQVRAMGRELVPSNPLFAAPASTDPYSMPVPPSREDLDFDRLDEGASAVAAAASAPVEDAFDFDLTERYAAPTPPSSTSYEPPSALNFDEELAAPAAPAPMPSTGRIEEDFGAGSEDAIGTKLDLAKAYLDMGDPEGARSMLEEVLGEGNENQKKEARKLLADIR